MARASRIYNVFHADKLLAAFTVKYEMESWAKKSGYGSAELKCISARDGKPDAGFVELEWEKPWDKPRTPAAEVAHKLAEHFRKTGQMK